MILRIRVISSSSDLAWIRTGQLWDSFVLNLLSGNNFLSAGLKYHDSMLSIRSSDEGMNALIGLPTAICENIAPDVRKKKPAYAHSLSKGNFGTRIAITPKIFQTPIIVRKYTG